LVLVPPRKPKIPPGPVRLTVLVTLLMNASVMVWVLLTNVLLV